MVRDSGFNFSSRGITNPKICTMNLLIRDARIIDHTSPFYNQISDLEITNGIITKMGAALENHDDFQELRLENLHVSQGWFDSSVSFGEPGFEERETIENGVL